MSDPTTVITQTGPVRGVLREGLRVFCGIPFAEAPRGPLRFALPVPRRPWSEPLDCTTPAAAAPHLPSELGRVIGLSTDHQSEDFLSVTVWTPAKSASARLPVMVWIHGGRFEGGFAASPLADGGELATRGDVVVVSLQYRVGVLGFLHLDGAPDNRGLYDQIAALEWVKANIAAFGGDPTKVTIFGSSAGGVSVAMLLAMPRARGLFARAIVQSGTAECIYPLEEAVMIRDEMLTDFGLTAAEARERLEAMDMATLCETQRKSSKRLSARMAVVFQPVLEPKSFPEHPLIRLRRGGSTGVALLVGTNRDEMKLAALESFDFGALEDAELSRRVREMLGLEEGPPIQEHVIRSYRAMARLRDQPNKEVWDAIATDFYFRYPAIRLADAHSCMEADTFMYTVTMPSGAFDGALGACHAIEIPLVFGTHQVPPMDMLLSETPDLETVSRQCQDIWIAFARFGNPGISATGRWPRYARGRRSTMLVGREISAVEPAYVEECSLWKSLWSDVRPVKGYDDGTPSIIPPRRSSSIFPMPI